MFTTSSSGFHTLRFWLQELRQHGVIDRDEWMVVYKMMHHDTDNYWYEVIQYCRGKAQDNPELWITFRTKQRLLGVHIQEE
jgi:hypothetical protein